ncbi:bZIP transcription factor [Thermosulfurimonas sp.]|uniref:bZIP transcription factor n=1 Tax=Thermosulfurimonas sp. TaxID=2080236 RepID=UPI0025FEF659|nr:bZIP transcription factor [Thermosulfurimonas sp.]
MKKIGVFLVLISMLLGVGKGVRASSGDEDLRSLVHQLLKEVQELKKENAELKRELEQIKAQRVPPSSSPSSRVSYPPKKPSFFSKGAYGSSPSGVDFYGFLKIDAVWQDANAVGDEYVLWVLPEHNLHGGHKYGADSTFTINFRHSRFGFNLYKDYHRWRLFGKLEMDFYTQSNEEDTLPWNPNHSPLRARRVFVGVEKGTWQLLAGLDWLTISQLYPHLSNFPAGTFMGNIGYRMPQIRLTKWFDLSRGRLKFEAALEKPYAFPRMEGIVWDEDPSDRAGYPGLEGRISYTTKILGQPALIALWGHYSEEEYDTVEGTEDADSYSLGLELKVPLPLSFARKAFILGEIWTGTNLDGYYTGGVNQGTRFYLDNGRYVTDLRTKYTNGGKIKDVDEIDARGGWVELEIFWTPKLVTHFGWGIDNPDDGDLKGVSGARLQQQMYYANFLYRFTREFALGGEYMYIDCDYRKSDGDDGRLNRFMTSFYYFF